MVNFTGDANNAGTPLLVALDWLRTRSKAHDPEGEGVNIFLYYPKQALAFQSNVSGIEMLPTEHIMLAKVQKG